MPEKTENAPAAAAWLEFAIEHQAGSFALQARASLQGSMAVLVGPSGAGKSSLLRAIAGLLRPRRGHVRLRGTTVWSSDPRTWVTAAARGCGLVMQRPALFPSMTAAGNIAFGLHRLAREEREQRVRGMAALFRLESLLGRRPGQLSGGEQQRVSVARTLAPYPRVLLLDEPFAGLNLRLKEEVLSDLTSWLAQRQTPVLHVTHDIAGAWRLGSRPGGEVLRMEEGRIVAQGTVHKVLSADRQQLLGLVEDTDSAGMKT